MKRKRPSSPGSDDNFDISAAITEGSQNYDDFDFDLASTKTKSNAQENEEDDSDGDEAFIAAQQAASNRKSSNLKGRTVKRGGGFQAMGLNANLLKAITRKGFSVPTPIQRKTIPLVLDGQDVVGMARTGSGKTAAFVVPMIEKLKAHSAKVGARALILSPSRELALQTLSVVKELAKGTDLRPVLLVGGDSLEDHFNAMTWNPDIIIATPGRFHHLKIEMKLDMSSIQYVVFDEADRLFEMGFAVQLTEIIHGLPPTRQTLLFSATLPKSLVEFARAGLHEPKLIRLDTENKVAPDLESAFFTVKSATKEGALLQILQDIIQMPVAPKSLDSTFKDQNKDKAKKRRKANVEGPSEYSTIIFAATKHRVEYLYNLLSKIGYGVSYVYGSLDQTARKINIQDFRSGNTTIMVVTDVAARGIDIPILANVINYDFPSQPKVFVHRVGRTARAGQRGWSYSLVHDGDIPYLIDLQLFLSRKLIVGQQNNFNSSSFAQDVVLGALPIEQLGSHCEWVEKTMKDDQDLASLRQVAARGEKLYIKTRNSASLESVKRAKSLAASHSMAELNPLFEASEDNSLMVDREDMLARLRKFRPAETIFEIGKRGDTGNDTIDSLRNARSKMGKRNYTAQEPSLEHFLQKDKKKQKSDESKDGDISNENLQITIDYNDSMSESEDEYEITQSAGQSHKDQEGNNNWQEAEHFMSYTPRLGNLAEDKGYGVHSGTSGKSSNFLLEANDVALDLTNDELKGFGLPNRPKMRWDKKSRKYVNTANDEDGSRGSKLVRGESGLKIAASLRSGKFEAWKRQNQIKKLPRVGEDESTNTRQGTAPWQQRRSFGRGGFHHTSDKSPKEADKFRDDYYSQKKKVAKAKENRIGRFKDGEGKNELRSLDYIRKQRKVKDIRRARNARPARNGSSGKKRS